MISSICSFHISNFAADNSKTFFSKSVSAAAAVNPGVFNTLLVSGVFKFFSDGKLTFINRTGSLPRNSPDCIISESSVFDNFLLADKSFAKVLQKFETCLLVVNNLCGKLATQLELSIVFDTN